jgi:hypothetical protein
MNGIRSILPKILVFGASALLGAAVASVVVTATRDNAPESTVGLAPEFLLTTADTPSNATPGTPSEAGVTVAFNVQPSGEPVPVSTLSPEDLAAAAAALLGGDTPQPPAALNPSGFPRVPPITQFDGGPKQGSNCTLASGSMLARLGVGVVTTGSTLRTLQDDQDGGTGINDLATALWRGYGVSFRSGLVRPDHLKALLAQGYGAVVQGDYSKVPRSLRLQKGFTGGHAIYLDGYYPGNAQRSVPEAYYVIDPLGRPRSGYEGEWWPASVVDDFATSFGGGRVAAMWAYPPGGVPPEVIDPDVLPIPADPGPDTGPGPGEASEPPASDTPASPEPAAPPPEPGDATVVLGDPPVRPVEGAEQGGISLVPVFDVCLFAPKPAGCPTGLAAVFERRVPSVVPLWAGPTVEILFVDSDRANVALVGFTVAPPAPGSVRYWKDEAGPSVVHHASAVSPVEVLGRTVLVARLEVDAATRYRFQAVAGDGLTAGVSEIGTLTSGSGVEQFHVTTSRVAAPRFQLESATSPYVHLAAGAFARPMIRLDRLGGAACQETADIGGTLYCLDRNDAAASEPCTRAEVTWLLNGIDADEVLVRAFPSDRATTKDGAMTLEGVIEATGPVPGGSLSIGCLASGLTYSIVLDAVGDDRGVLARETVSVP